ncbi:hypothetical protein QBC45DRAFT_412134 [Copromyces sp. CBS 386.78]|nr:hypothetical protein QBC45DRAFT_412134 [Copromyces sp. CBS 386.78]
MPLSVPSSGTSITLAVKLYLFLAGLPSTCSTWWPSKDSPNARKNQPNPGVCVAKKYQWIKITPTYWSKTALAKKDTISRLKT